MKRVNYTFCYIFFILIIIIFSCLKVSSQSTLDSLESILPKITNDSVRVDVLNQIAWENVNTGYTNQSFEYVKKAIVLSDKINYKAGKAKALNITGVAYTYNGDYPAALKYFNASLNIKKSYGDKEGMAASYNNIGLVYDNQGNVPEALKSHLMSLKIAEEILDTEGVARSYNNIGLIYYSQGSYQEALKNFKSALIIRKVINDRDGMADSYSNLGLLYMALKKYPEALLNHAASLKIEQETGDNRGTANSYNNIGAINWYLRNDSAAIANLQIALKIQKELDDKEGMIYTYITLASVYLTDRKISEAEKYANPALELAREIANTQLIGESYSRLYKIDSAKGNYKRAFEEHQLYIAYRDSLYNEENTKKTVQLQMTYEYQKKEIIKEQEEKERIKKEQEEISRRNTLQYTIIFLFILLVIGLVLSLGFIKVPVRFAQGLIFVSLLLVFEFLLVYMDPLTDRITNGVPIYKLIVNTGLAIFIFPIHAFLEKRFKRKVEKLK